jgi:hypothetical protein
MLAAMEQHAQLALSALQVQPVLLVMQVTQEPTVTLALLATTRTEEFAVHVLESMLTAINVITALHAHYVQPDLLEILVLNVPQGILVQAAMYAQQGTTPLQDHASLALLSMSTVTPAATAQPARLAPQDTLLPPALPALLGITPQLQVHSSAVPAVQQ